MIKYDISISKKYHFLKIKIDIYLMYEDIIFVFADILIIQLVSNKVVLPPTFTPNLIPIYFDKDILLHVSYSARLILFHFFDLSKQCQLV